MKNLARTFVTGAALAVTASTALAHPGHDHSHWSSPAVHALLATAIVAVIGVSVWALRNRKQSSQSLKKEEK